MLLTLLLSTAIVAPLQGDTPSEGTGKADLAQDGAAQDGALGNGIPIGFMPEAVTSFGAEAQDGWIYILCGYHGIPHHYREAGQSSTFYRVSVDDPRILEHLPSPGRAQSVSLVGWNGKLVRTGGMRIHDHVDADDSDLVSLDTCAIYDPAERAWTELPSLPEPRSSHESEVLGHHLFVAGGWNMQADGTEWSQDLLVLDLENPDGGWQQIEQPFERRALSVAGVGRTLMVLGGISSDRKMEGNVDLFDTETGMWSKGPAYPGSAFAASVARYGERLYATSVDGGQFSWAPGEEDWRRESSNSTFSRFFHQLVADDDALYTMGGIQGMQGSGRIRAIERLDVGRTGAKVTSFEVPYPGDGRNRQATFLMGEHLYLFGGNRTLGQHAFEEEDFSNQGWRLALSTLRWERLNDLPAGRQSMQAWCDADTKRAYLMGGFGHPGADGEACSCDEIWTYDIETDTWLPETQLDKPRSQFGLAHWDGHLVAMAGLDFDPDREERFVHLTHSSRGAVTEASFQASEGGPTLVHPRRAFAGAQSGSSYYMVGGTGPDRKDVRVAERVDLISGEIEEILAPSQHRLGGRLVPLEDGRLVLIGGNSKVDEGGLAPNRTVEVFDPKTGTWTVALEDLGFDPSHLNAVALGNRVLIASSHLESGRTMRLAFLDV